MQGVELGPRPDVARGRPLDRWEEFLDSEGRVKNPEKIKELVFRGVRPETGRTLHLLFVSLNLGHILFCFVLLSLLQGIAPSLRKEVWKFLLGFYPWNSTMKERDDILRLKTLVLLLPSH